MTNPRRKFLLIFLTLLQFIAPLVHAHTSSNAAFLPATTGKLHVPGLEIYALHHETVLSASDNYLDVDSLFVGVDTGIQSIHDKVFTTDDCPQLHYLPAQFFNFATAPPEPVRYFSPQSIAPLARCAINSHSPRAPPAHYALM